MKIFKQKALTKKLTKVYAKLFIVRSLWKINIEKFFYTDLLLSNNCLAKKFIYDKTLRCQTDGFVYYAISGKKRKRNVYVVVLVKRFSKAFLKFHFGKTLKLKFFLL